MTCSICRGAACPHVSVEEREMARSSSLDALDTIGTIARLRDVIGVKDRENASIRAWASDMFEAGMVTDSWAIAALGRCADLEQENDALERELAEVKAQLATAERHIYVQLRKGPDHV